MWGGISYDADGGKDGGKEVGKKAEDVSRRQLNRISQNSFDLFLSITAFAAGAATQPSTEIAGLLV